MQVILLTIIIIAILINLVLAFKLNENLDRLQQCMVDYEMLEMKLTQLVRRVKDGE